MGGGETRLHLWPLYSYTSSWAGSFQSSPPISLTILLTAQGSLLLEFRPAISVLPGACWAISKALWDGFFSPAAEVAD